VEASDVRKLIVQLSGIALGIASLLLVLEDLQTVKAHRGEPRHLPVDGHLRRAKRQVAICTNSDRKPSKAIL
jgi:hypothetical protein